MIRAKKPWAAAAAAALLLGVVGTAFGYAWQYHAYTAGPVEAAKKQGDGVANEYSSWNTKYQAADAKVKEDEEDVRRIIMGTDERLNWLMLNEFINQCMPVPALRADGKLKEATAESITITGADGKDQKIPADSAAFVAKDKNDRWQFVSSSPKPGDAITVIYQTDPGAKEYFKFPEVREASLRYFDRQEITKPGQAKPADEDLSRLIQVNLESVYALHSPDVKSIYSKLVTDKFLFLGMDEKKKEEMAKGNGLPEGPGWVIELRGYSYFGDSPRFVINTLLREIERRGAGPDQTGGGNATQPGQPPAASPGSTSTPPTTPPTDADSSADKEQAVAKDPVKEKEENWNKVIRGRVSHPFLLDYDIDKDAEPGKFKILGGSALDSLVGQSGSSTAAAATTSAPAGGGGGGQGNQAGMERAARMGAMSRMGAMGGGGGGGGGAGGAATGSGGFSALVPVGGSSGSGGGSSGPNMGGGRGAMGGEGMMADINRRMGQVRGRLGGNPMAGGGMGSGLGGFNLQPAKAPPKKATGDRTEFKLIFVWREWTPSDDLIKKEQVATEIK